jgi:hypothetical protein
MSTTLFKYGDRVRHRDGKDYHLTDVTPNAIGISDGVGVVFIGSVEQARSQGFAFGDEEFYSNARPISHFDLPFLAEMAEGALVGASITEEQRRLLLEFAASAPLEIDRLQKALAFRLTKANEAIEELGRFKEQVRLATIAAAQESNLCRESVNKFLTGLGLQPWALTWVVTGRLWGQTLIEVHDVEADDDGDAIEWVRTNLALTLTSLRFEAQSSDTALNTEFGSVECDSSQSEIASPVTELLRLARWAMEWSAEEQDA